MQKDIMPLVTDICNMESTSCRSLNKSELARKIMDFAYIPTDADIQEIPLDWDNQVVIHFLLPNDNNYYSLFVGIGKDDNIFHFDLSVTGKLVGDTFDFFDKEKQIDNDYFKNKCNEIKWENYGDINFWEYGVLVRRHWEDKEGEYDILRCYPDGNSDKYHVTSLYVDIRDTWFQNELDAIASTMDCKVRDFENEVEKIRFAIAVTDYYNEDNFQPEYPNGMIWNTQQDSYEWLKDFEIGELISKPIELINDDEIEKNQNSWDKLVAIADELMRHHNTMNTLLDDSEKYTHFDIIQNGHDENGVLCDRIMLYGDNGTIAEQDYY